MSEPEHFTDDDLKSIREQATNPNGPPCPQWSDETILGLLAIIDTTKKSEAELRVEYDDVSMRHDALAHRLVIAETKIDTYEKGMGGALGMRWIQEGARVAMMLAEPVNDDTVAKNYVQLQMGWDEPIKGLPFQKVVVAFIRPGGLTPHERAEVALAKLAKAELLLGKAGVQAFVLNRIDELMSSGVRELESEAATLEDALAEFMGADMIAGARRAFAEMP